MNDSDFYHGAGNVRKGQFFIIGAVIIIFSLTALNGILNQDRDLKLSDMQKDRTLFLLDQIESDVLNLIVEADYLSIPDAIEEYFVFENIVLRNLQYSVLLEKEITYIGLFPNNISINYTVMSSDMHISREIRTNAGCLRYDYDGLCANLAGDTGGVLTAANCCSHFNLCC